MNPEEIKKLVEQLLPYALQLLAAVAVLLVGLWIINKLMAAMARAMERSRISKEIHPFLLSMSSILLKVLLLFSAAGMLGINTASFVAVLAAAGFAVGMALQGSLSNFAAGVMLLIFKPYKIGDLIEIGDYIGHVREIQIFNTILEAPDKRTVIMPNSEAGGNTVVNWSTRKMVRVEVKIPMPYGEDFPRVRDILLPALKNTQGVLSEPEPEVGIDSFDSHYIELSLRAYCRPDDYWPVYYAMGENAKRALSEGGVMIAYSEGVEMGKIGL